MKVPKKRNYPTETIGRIMSADIPVCRSEDTLEQILQHITSESWDSVRNVYVVDENGKLLGYIGLGTLVQRNHRTKAHTLMTNIADVLHPEDDQEKAVFLAVKDNEVTMPVVDNDGHLLGAVTARKVISIMHDEHIEDALMASGVRRGSGLQIAKLATERTGLIVRSRAPWLIVGLVAGMGLGLISSLFEESLRTSIALAYFIPVVAYIADSVGTQSEAIAVRALAVIKINYWRYLTKELFVGFSLGLLVGTLGAVGAALISGSLRIGAVVGLALLAASTIAAVIASVIPIIFKLKGKDPAIGSGPFATAIQDLVSILVYFGLAVWLI